MASNATRLFIALYTDADVNGKLAKQIRARGYDALSAFEAGTASLKDEPQLEYAVSLGRALLSHNARDFEPLYEKWWAEGREHFGIILAEQLPIGELLRRILKMLDTVDADQMKNSIRYLGEFK